MALNVVARETLTVGTPLVVDADSPAGRFAVVFEDDGETGYFYAVDTEVEDGNPVQDALQVYEVAHVTDAEQASQLEIGWSDDGLKVLLLINEHAHAAFDFERRQGWCRLGYPAPTGPWSKAGHDWDDAVDALFDGAA
jgi:hypothetical protein